MATARMCRLLTSFSGLHVPLSVEGRATAASLRNGGRWQDIHLKLLTEKLGP
jgi:hypothetical protein